MEYEFQNQLPEKASPNFNCYQWTIVQELNFVDRSHIQVTVEKERNVCEEAKRYSWQNYYWLHFLVLVLAIISLVAHWQYIIAVSRTYDKLRTRFENKRFSKSLFKGLAKNKVKIQRKNKDYKRCLSGISGHGTKVACGADHNNNENELSFVERAGIGKILVAKLYFSTVC